MHTVVLTHGFWHGSWCWSRVSAQLARRGVPSVAVDLDGHGLNSRSPAARWRRPFDPAAFATEPSGVAGVTASSAAASLAEQLKVIGGGEPCVVVAHSMGGAVVTAAAEREPSLFAHLVYVSAFAPVAGRPPVEYVFSPENRGELVSALSVADPAVVGALRVDTSDPDGHPAIRAAFYGDVDEATSAAAISLLEPDAPAGVTTEALVVTGERYGTVPHSYVVCTQDNAIREPLQRRFITEIDQVSERPTSVTELDCSHSPFLSRPEELAAAIAVAAG
jgi:pimeloyl-ACP methyl ester carboxylesterase